MNKVRFATAVAIAVLILGTAPSLFAANSSATGGFHLTLPGGPTNIEFEARATDATGSGNGQMTFNGAAELPDADEDSGGQKGSFSNVFIKVDFDCVRIEQNRAAMSGLIRDANVNGYTGRRLILTVEDGGEGNNAEPDKFTFGVYNTSAMNWIPSDSELRFDDGWSMTWLATDSERQDDRGVQITRNADVDCRSFSFANYTLIDVPQGGGNIQVRP
ncbi:MAG TPA: hypothetical protein VLV78_16720 [Thermoanaerobaculia bacterium]|nr:hypothetical protein [Thermoanaerobaculia bacterium]